MLHVFTINNTIDASCVFKQGVPLPRGMFSANTLVNLVHEDNTIVSCSSKVLGLWPDKSVRWMLLEGVAKLRQSGSTRFFLTHASYQSLSIKPQWVYNQADSITLQLKNTSLQLSKSAFLCINTEHLLSAVECYISLEDQATALANIETQYEVVYDKEQQPLFCDIEQSATLSLNGDGAEKKYLNLSAELRIYYQSGAIQLTLTLHNPQAHIHHGGKWDLGNENSIFVRDFSLQFTIEKAATKTFVSHKLRSLNELGQYAKRFTDLFIIQHSSGGEFWNSPNHKSRDNQIHLKQRGATIALDMEVDKAISIDRPEPLVAMTSKSQRAVIHPQHFWQKFPTRLHATGQYVRLDYTDSQQAFELQPGEKMSHTMTFWLQDEDKQSELSDALLEPIELMLSPSLLQHTAVLPWFVPTHQHDPLQILINEGIFGEQNFFKKREALDEFGWRNFGDIYADHEAANHTENVPFVSHYNNQYDPLYGFLKQWMLSGEDKWKSLADDLFDHLVHIDIYHTELDKPEYNNGLFWHTDHYLQAETASHRTYSKHQPSDVYQDHAGGGGPGSHHCYTSGLVLYYWLSGNKKAFQCMLKMNDWMHYIYEGDRTLLGLVLAVKNANHLRVPFTRRLLLGAGTGTVRNVFTDKYPLDRGTGNYVNAILDAYELTQDLQYLDDAERVIVKTISSQDDVSERNFEDIENTWYYVVFLQSVAKYLYFVSKGPQSLAPYRRAWAPIKSAFLHYVHYICEKEQPYLTQQEKLEYPNDTWTAQDLRKVQLLVIGSVYANNEEKAQFINKATELNDWIMSRLQQSDERAYTRILTLMMQNYGALKILEASSLKAMQSMDDEFYDDSTQGIGMYPEKPKSKLLKILTFIKHYSISREKRHLVQRIPKLQKWLGKP